MSETSKTPGNSENPDSGDVPPPPPIMPTPDIIDPLSQGPTYGGKEENSKRSRKDKKRSHPLDPYEPLKKRKGCRGCCGCIGGLLGLVVILIIALFVVVGWFGPGRYVFDGYEVVSFEEAQTKITVAPDKPTYYIGQSIEYSAPATNVPIAILGTEISFSGYFTENVSISGAKVFARAATKIDGDLEVYAAEFLDEGIELRGALKGSVMKNLSP
ncbi:MAG: hypothetical protein P1U58_02975 [Verrucomicrobiales bacterium]|nr:hypothetical protein [Verrucomicrobiales bacterium]